MAKYSFPNKASSATKFQTKEAPPPALESSFEDCGDTGIVTTRSTRVKTVEELLSFMQVDLSEWNVDRYVVNKWEVGAQDLNGNLLVEPLFQVKAWLKRKGPASPERILFEDTLKKIKAHAPSYPSLKVNPKVIKDHLLEVCVPDLHLGKLSWGAETGADYDIPKAKKLFLEAVVDLVSRAAPFGVEKIVFPIGNDFFNIDNSRNMTTAGTPQDVDTRWQKSFLEGRDLILETIDFLQSVAPVDIYMIPGNHDQERMLYLGCVIDACYSKANHVTVFNEPKQRKYFLYGTSLIGYTHGNREKKSELPLIMADEVPVLWAKSVFREFHIGHIHSKALTNFVPDTIESRGVRVRTIPSLSASDAWHDSKGYRGQRSAEAYLIHRTKGFTANFSFNLAPNA